MACAPDRPPMGGYEQACFWVLAHSPVEDWLFDDAAHVPLEVSLIADIFLRSEALVVADLRRLRRGVLLPGSPRPAYSRGGEWRLVSR